MTEAEHSDFIAHISSKTKTSPVCPLCGPAKWKTQGPVVALCYDEDADGTLVLGSGNRGIPCVFMICETCGFILQFSWLTIQGRRR